MVLLHLCLLDFSLHYIFAFTLSIVIFFSKWGGMLVGLACFPKISLIWGIKNY